MNCFCLCMQEAGVGGGTCGAGDGDEQLDLDRDRCCSGESVRHAGHRQQANGPGGQQPAGIDRRPGRGDECECAVPVRSVVVESARVGDRGGGLCDRSSRPVPPHG